MDGKTLLLEVGTGAGLVVTRSLLGSIFRPHLLRAVLLVVGSAGIGAALGAALGWGGWCAYVARLPSSGADQHGYRYRMFPLPNAQSSDTLPPDTIVALLGGSFGGAVGAIIGVGLGGRAREQS